MNMKELEKQLHEYNVYRMVVMFVGKQWQVTASKLNADKVQCWGSTFGEALMELLKKLEIG